MCRLEEEDALKRFKELVKANSAKKVGTSKTGSQSKSSGSSWANVGGAGKKPASSGSKSAASKGSSFAAAFDSDSD
jgi:hypothetical protein